MAELKAKRCEGALEKPDGTFEQCDAPAEGWLRVLLGVPAVGEHKGGKRMSVKKKSAMYIEQEKRWGEYAVVGVAAEKSVTFQRLRKFGLVREMNFPHYRLTTKEKAQELRSLFKYGPAKIVGGENGLEIAQTMHALGTCWSYFPHAWEVRSGDALTPMEVFMDDEMLMKALDKRAYNGSVSSLTDSEVRKGLKYVTGAQGVSNFRPTAAWALYDRHLPDGGRTAQRGGYAEYEGAGYTVYDPSMGWGGRLVGAVGCLKVAKYIGCDPSTKTFAGLKAMEADIRRMMPNRNLQVEIHMLGSENFCPAPGSVDIAFTSPPYFEDGGIVERYSDEPTQSHIRFPTREAWLEGFIGQTIRNCHVALKPGGILALNVSDELAEAVTNQAVENGFVPLETLRLRLSKIPGSTKYKNCWECQRLTGEANGTDPVVPTFGGKWKKCPEHTHKREPIFVFRKKS